MFADFLETYGMNLVDILFVEEAPRMTPRLLLSLVYNLPEGSAFMAEMRGGPEFRSWTTSTYLTAAVVNSVNAGTMVAANVPKSQRAQYPPIEGPVKPKKVGITDVMSHFGGAPTW